MLKTDYPVYFDDIELKIRRLQWGRDYENISNEYQTEDGHDDVEVIRKGKAVIRASFQVSDVWASILAEFNDKPFFSVRFYDVKTKDYTTLTMRMDGLSIDEEPYSDTVSSSNGLYTVSFDLLEF